MRRIFVFALIVVAGFSCTKTTVTLTSEERLAHDVAIIDKYLDDNRIVAQKFEDGLRLVISETGTGAIATAENCITVNYTGWVLYEETPFQTNTGYRSALRNNILGWRLAFKYLPLGSKATLYIPSNLAYASVSRGAIPAYGILKFDVELTAISAYNSLGEYCY